MEQRRVACLIQAEYEKDQNLLEATKEVESGADSDFITAVDEKSIVDLQEPDGHRVQRLVLRCEPSVRRHRHRIRREF